MAGKRTSKLRIFVRIGALKRFHALKEKTKDLPVTVSWDRRRGERREGPAPSADDQRQQDRRGAPPFTWQVADFVVLEEPAREADVQAEAGLKARRSES